MPIATASNNDTNQSTERIQDLLEEAKNQESVTLKLTLDGEEHTIIAPKSHIDHKLTYNKREAAFATLSIFKSLRAYQTIPIKTEDDICNFGMDVVILYQLKHPSVKLV